MGEKNTRPQRTQICLTCPSRSLTGAGDDTDELGLASLTGAADVLDVDAFPDTRGGTPKKPPRAGLPNPPKEF